MPQNRKIPTTRKFWRLGWPVWVESPWHHLNGVEHGKTIAENTRNGSGRSGLKNYSLQNDGFLCLSLKDGFCTGQTRVLKRNQPRMHHVIRWGHDSLLWLKVEPLNSTLPSNHFKGKWLKFVTETSSFFFVSFLYNWFFIELCRFLQRRLKSMLDVDLRLLSVCIELWLEVIIWGFLNEGDATSVDSRQVSVWWLGVGWVKPFWLKLVDLFVPTDTYESWPHPNTW